MDERTLRNKIPETLKSGCLGAQRGESRVVVPAGSCLRGARWLRGYFPAVPKAINKPKTSSVGVGLVKPVAPKRALLIAARLFCEVLLEWSNQSRRKNENLFGFIDDARVAEHVG